MTDQPSPAPVNSGPWHSLQVLFHRHASPGTGREQYTTGHLNVAEAHAAIDEWAARNGVDPDAAVDPATGLAPDAYLPAGEPVTGTAEQATLDDVAPAASGPPGDVQEVTEPGPDDGTGPG